MSLNDSLDFRDYHTPSFRCLLARIPLISTKNNGSRNSDSTPDMAAQGKKIVVINFKVTLSFNLQASSSHIVLFKAPK